jgi:hypothetical protein
MRTLLGFAPSQGIDRESRGAGSALLLAVHVSVPSRGIDRESRENTQGAYAGLHVFQSPGMLREW